MNFRQIIQDYFTFSRNERKGIAILLVLIFMLAVANKMVFYFETPAAIDTDFLEAPIEADNLIGGSFTTRGLEPKLFKFNPNTIDRDALDSLSLPEGIKRNVLKYREKGGVYYSGKDFRKMYGVTDSIYRQVASFLVFEKVPDSQKRTLLAHVTEKEQNVGPENNQETAGSLIEINAADSIELMMLPGIGQKLSKRIVKYRDLLGGFYTFEQLKEVYGLSKQTIGQIEGMIRVDPAKIRKVDLNFADWNELAGHPYIQKSLATKIIKFRTKYGSINEPSVLKDSIILKAEEYLRLKPYL